MPRQARLDAPGTLHHVMGRGIEKTAIFRKEEDRKDFLNRVALLYQGKAWKALCLCTDGQPLPSAGTDRPAIAVIQHEEAFNRLCGQLQSPA